MSAFQYLTAEAVSEGHPDKLADQISDAVLDEYLRADPEARVACEVLLSGRFVVVAGEISATVAPIREIADIVRRVILDVGYTRASLGFDLGDLEIHATVQDQSRQIAKSVSKKNGQIGAGDQGIMFGYATDETPECLPYPVALAKRLMRLHSTLRHKGQSDWLWPDAKCQITMKYENGVPRAIDTVLFSTQHAPSVTLRDLRKRVNQTLITPILEKSDFPILPKILINPAGTWSTGGPVADTGLTGRKIVADSYGPFCPVGGGAFSGKDPTKVDRSGAYMARHIAVNVVSAGLAKRCTISIAYAIGKTQPVSVDIDCHGTETAPLTSVKRAVFNGVDLSPSGIINHLKLRRPIFLSTARCGHFGTSDRILVWERTCLAIGMRNTLKKIRREVTE